MTMSTPSEVHLLARSNHRREPVAAPAFLFEGNVIHDESEPSAAKAASLANSIGTAEAVPFPNFRINPFPMLSAEDVFDFSQQGAALWPVLYVGQSFEFLQQLALTFVQLAGSLHP